MREQERAAAHASCGEGGLCPSVAASDHDDVESLRELHRERPRILRDRFTWNQRCRQSPRFHVKHPLCAAMQHDTSVGQSIASGPVISLARYAALLTPRDLKQTIAVSMIGRLPIGITGLAILLLVQTSTDSFSKGGAAAACYVIGLATVAPGLGRLIDRNGPRLALLGCSIAFPVALVGLVASVEARSHAAAILIFAAAAGATFPPISVCMRAYFKQRLSDDVLLATAYSLESVLIETIFIIGPMLVALFVAAASPAAAVLFAAASGCVGTLLFLRSPPLRTWRIEPRAPASVLGPLGQPRFVVLIAIILCYSMAFGLLEIGVTAYATERGHAALAGVLLGLMSTGSALGGIAYGSRSWHLPLSRQFALMLGLMGAGLMVLTLPWTPWPFAFWSLFAGIVMAPALIIQSMLVAKSARPSEITEAFTWSASALLCGVGVGIAAGGGLLVHFSSPAVLASGSAAALLAATAAALIRLD
jgi:predicted MFS family arabinose efflux permease